MHSEHPPYAEFTSRARLDKSINSLLGLVVGIAMDKAINLAEVEILDLWLSEHADARDTHPFNELIPVVQATISDGVFTQDDRDDIVWLCGRLRSTEYYDKTTGDLQRLHAILGGIVEDGVITEAELSGLSEWLQNHEHLKTCWPYGEIDSLIVAVLKDRRIDEKEHGMLVRPT